jgi:hypothetical protein
VDEDPPEGQASARRPTHRSTTGTGRIVLPPQGSYSYDHAGRAKKYRPIKNGLSVLPYVPKDPARARRLLEAIKQLNDEREEAAREMEQSRRREGVEVDLQ